MYNEGKEVFIYVQAMIEENWWRPEMIEGVLGDTARLFEMPPRNGTGSPSPHVAVPRFSH
jgi:hypothetical protein